jgi:diphthamide biosynthesis methyltransferase
MPVLNTTADKIIGYTLVSEKENLPYYNKAGGTVLGTFKKGETIGVVYSYATGGTNKLYWQINRPLSSGGYEAIFIEHNQQYLTIVNGADLVKKLQEEKDKQRFEEVGALRFYIEKYAPLIIGVGIGIVIIPKLLKSNND